MGKKEKRGIYQGHPKGEDLDYLNLMCDKFMGRAGRGEKNKELRKRQGRYVPLPIKFSFRIEPRRDRGGTEKSANIVRRGKSLLSMHSRSLQDSVGQGVTDKGVGGA